MNTVVVFELGEDYKLKTNTRFWRGPAQIEISEGTCVTFLGIDEEYGEYQFYLRSGIYSGSKISISKNADLNSILKPIS
jgi:hypothetical protein